MHHEPLELTMKKIEAATTLATVGNSTSSDGAIKRFSKAYSVISEAIKEELEKAQS